MRHAIDGVSLINALIGLAHRSDIDEYIKVEYSARYNEESYIRAVSSVFDDVGSDVACARGIALQSAALALLRESLLGGNCADELESLGSITGDEYSFLLLFVNNVHIDQCVRLDARYINCLHLHPRHRCAIWAARELVLTGRGDYICAPDELRGRVWYGISDDDSGDGELVVRFKYTRAPYCISCAEDED